MSAVIAARKAVRAAGGAPVPTAAYVVKAWAECCRDLPELRRSYVTLPWPRLYEHPISVASLIVERDFDGEKAVLPTRIKAPAERSLDEVAQEIMLAATAPIESLQRNREILRVSRLPRVLRRLSWWLVFNWPRHRQYYVGTFGVSALGHLGATIMNPVSPVTTCVCYGPFGADGAVQIAVGFDHRAMDGAVVARGMALLEEKLRGLAAA